MLSLFFFNIVWNTIFDFWNFKIFPIRHIGFWMQNKEHNGYIVFNQHIDLLGSICHCCTTKQCLLSCKKGLWEFLALLLYCSLADSVTAWKKVIINHASVINPQILHSPVGADNETRHKPLTLFWNELAQKKQKDVILSSSPCTMQWQWWN